MICVFFYAEHDELVNFVIACTVGEKEQFKDFH